MALAPFVIRHGPDASSDVLRQRRRCTKCGRKGATLMHPSAVASNEFQVFPVERIRDGVIT
jgi:hypothetical protein